MFSWSLFLCLMLVCIPGVLTAVRSASLLVLRLGETRLPVNETLPPCSVILAVSMVQTMILIAIPAAAGTALAPRVGLHAPFFAALVSSSTLWPQLCAQVLPAIVVGGCGGLIFLMAYYGYFRPRMDQPTLSQMEGLRRELGLAGRIFYGGIAEEVMTRWGVMTFTVWLGARLTGSQSPWMYWIAIVLSGILFGLGHLPGYLAVGCRLSPILLALMISLNLWASVLFGWLFWRYGLLAAMLAHSIFHLLWVPLELFHLRMAEGKEKDSGAERKIIQDPLRGEK